MEQPAERQIAPRCALEEITRTQKPDNSRAMFLLSAMLGGGAVVTRLLSAARAEEFAPHEIDVLNFDLTFEYLQAGFYDEALRFGALGPETKRWARVIGAHEHAHVDILRSVLGRRAVKKLERLWRLYPLDPEVGRQDGPIQTELDSPAKTPPITSDPESQHERDATTSNTDQEGVDVVAILVASALVGVGVLSVGLVSRRWSKGEAASSGERMERVLETLQVSVEQEPQEIRRRSEMQQSRKASHVRVHLKDGRVVEGRVKHAATPDHLVLLLDVVDVADATGQKTEPDPHDGFVPLVEIGRMETIEEPSSNRNGRE